jgi:hypothetical protein
MIAMAGNDAATAEKQKTAMRQWMADAIGGLLAADLELTNQDQIKRAAALSLEHNIDAVIDDIEDRINSLEPRH